MPETGSVSATADSLSNRANDTICHRLAGLQAKPSSVLRGVSENASCIKQTQLFEADRPLPWTFSLLRLLSTISSSLTLFSSLPYRKVKFHNLNKKIHHHLLLYECFNESLAFNDLYYFKLLFITTVIELRCYIQNNTFL